MSRTIPASELAARVPELLNAVGSQTIFLEKDGVRVAAIVSLEEYESTHEARANRAIRAMEAFGEHMSSVATQDELEALAVELDRHNL